MKIFIIILFLIFVFESGYTQVTNSISIPKLTIDSISSRVTNSPNKDTGFFKFLSSAHISIAKSFTGSSSDAKHPASFFWYKDFGNKYSYSLIDLGLKWTPYDLSKKSHNLLFTPKFEWHEDGDTTSKNKNKKNSIDLGVNIEYQKQNGDMYPIFIGSLEYKNDFIKKIPTVNFSGYASLFARNKFWPGSMKIRDSKSDLIFRYYPYTGFEYYVSATTISKTAAYWGSRISFEFYPFTRFIQTTFDYTYRVKLFDNLYKQGNLQWLSVGLNYYLDSKKRIGVGFSYNRGNDPNNSFSFTNLFDFGLKIQF